MSSSSKSNQCHRGYSAPGAIPPKTVIQVEDSAVKANSIISKDSREDDSYKSSNVESEGTLGTSTYLHLRKEMDEEPQLAVKTLASSPNKITANKHDSSLNSSSGVSENSFYSTGSYSPELTMTLIRPDPNPPSTVPSSCTNNHSMYNDDKTSNESATASSPFEQSCLVGFRSDVRKDGDTTVYRETLWNELFEAIPPNEHEMMLIDINEQGLEELGLREGVMNLSIGNFPSVPFPVEGVIYHMNNRLMVNLVCRRAKKPVKTINVWFVVDTGSNATFVAKKTIEALIGPNDPFSPSISLALQDPDIAIDCNLSPLDKHFPDANVLGMAALRQLNVSIANMDFKKNTFKLVRE